MKCAVCERPLSEVVITLRLNPNDPTGLTIAQELNSADWQRIEAALRSLVPEMMGKPAERAYLRTLDKVEFMNQTGPYTKQNR